MNDAVKLAAGLVALYVALTWSYAGYTTPPSKMEETVADRAFKNPYASP